MNSLLCFLLCFFSMIMHANESLVKDYEQLVQDHEKACYKTIDTIFAQARASLEAKEDIITIKWLKREAIKEITNNISNAQIELGFDWNAKNVISEKIQHYLQSKIRNEADRLFENKDVTVDQVKQFFHLSEMVCGLSQGTDCCAMIRVIKNENFPCLYNLKIKQKVEQQEKKEERRDVCQSILFGAHLRS